MKGAGFVADAPRTQLGHPSPSSSRSRAFRPSDWSLAHPYLSFFPAIILAEWYGGFRPGCARDSPGGLRA